MDQTRLLKGAVLTESAVEFTAEAGKGVRGYDGAGKMGLTEEGDDSVAFLEAGDAWAGGDDAAGPVGSGDYGDGNGERIFALGRDM